MDKFKKELKQIIITFYKEKYNTIIKSGDLKIEFLKDKIFVKHSEISVIDFSEIYRFYK